jgi:hypothetical protein
MRSHTCLFQEVSGARGCCQRNRKFGEILFSLDTDSCIHHLILEVVHMVLVGLPSGGSLGLVLRGCVIKT